MDRVDCDTVVVVITVGAEVFGEENKLVDANELRTLPGNSDRSRSRKATVIGCPHIVIGPVTVATVSSKRPMRFLTNVVEPAGKVLRQPTKSLASPPWFTVVTVEVNEKSLQNGNTNN